MSDSSIAFAKAGKRPQRPRVWCCGASSISHYRAIDTVPQAFLLSFAAFLRVANALEMELFGGRLLHRVGFFHRKGEYESTG